MNHLVLDMSDPDIKAALQGCASGDEVELTVKGTLTIAGDAATVNVTEVKYDAEGSATEEAGESPAEAASEGDAPSAVKAVSSKM